MHVLANATADLEQCEATIKEHLASFVEVGRALAAIRNGRLYKQAGFTTFEAYCRERWEMSRIHAHRLVESAGVVGRLLPVGNNPLPTAETHVRPLTKLPPDQQPEAWREAVETAPDGKVTAKHVASVVRRLLPKDNAPPVREPVLEFCQKLVEERGEEPEFLMDELTEFVRARRSCTADTPRRIFVGLSKGDGEPQRLAYETVDRAQSRYRLTGLWPDGRPAEERDESKAGGDDHDEFTARFLELHKTGMSGAQIAETLGIQTHQVSHMRKKLGLRGGTHDRSRALVVRAQDQAADWEGVLEAWDRYLGNTSPEAAAELIDALKGLRSMAAKMISRLKKEA